LIPSEMERSQLAGECAWVEPLLVGDRETRCDAKTTDGQFPNRTRPRLLKRSAAYGRCQTRSTVPGFFDMAKETGEGPMTCRPRGSTSSHGLSVSETSLPGFATDMTDWGKIDVYGQFIRRDPFRNGLHYPAVLAELGDPNEM